MKIVFFIGRHHHAQKLQNVIESLRANGHDAITLIATNSVNIDPSSEFIWRYDANPRHTYDYLNVDLMRVVDTIANDLASYRIHSDLIRTIAPFWTTHSIREASECLVAFDNMLQIEKPDAVFVLHSNNYWGRMLLYLAQLHGVTTYATQEGLLRHRDQTTQSKQTSSADYVDKLLTWFDDDKQAYVDAGIESNRIVACGPFHLDRYIALKRSPDYRSYQAQFKHSLGLRYDKPLVSFMPPVASRYEGDLSRALVELSKFCSENAIQLAIRLHPFDYGIVSHVKSMLRHYSVTYYEQDDSLALMAFSDAVVSQQSTTMLEAMCLDAKRIEIDLDRVGVLESFAKRGYATLIETNELKSIFDVLNTNEETSEVAEWKRCNAMLLDGNATVRITQEIEAKHG